MRSAPTVLLVALPHIPAGRGRTAVPEFEKIALGKRFGISRTCLADPARRLSGRGECAASVPNPRQASPSGSAKAFQTP